MSASRMRALTLVIDTDNGTDSRVTFAVSTRRCPENAISDLRCREGTVMKRIGFYFADSRRRCEPDVPGTIAPWAREKRFDVVVWTGLPSNFRQEVNKTVMMSDFSAPPDMKLGRCGRTSSVIGVRCSGFRVGGAP